MTITPNYQKTLHACYLGYVTQAICANFAPLLFLTFQKSYHISMGELALIPTVFFLTQLMIDLVAANFVDRIGYRTCLVAAHGMAAVGLVLLAFLPDLLPVPFLGILISVMVYAVSSGLVEVVVSPIVEACPFDKQGQPDEFASFLLLLGHDGCGFGFHGVFCLVWAGKLADSHAAVGADSPLECF